MTAAPKRQFGPQLSFEGAKVLVFDPVVPNRATMRSALSMLGFRQISATSVYDEVGVMLRHGVFDLLVADVTHDPTATCTIVRDIREGRVGANPFLHVVLITWKLEGELVRKALNCGADDLVTRPFSVDFLRARVTAHTQARKPFVVTSDYIGPERRQGTPRPNSATQFAVPNTLLSKTRDPHASDHALAANLEEIRTGIARINGERARKNAFQIAFLLHFLRDAMTTAAPLDDYLKRLEAAAKDLVHRTQPAEAAVISKIAPPLLAEITGAQSGDNVAAHIERMGDHAASLMEAFNPSRTREDLLREVETVAANVKASGRKI